MIIIPNKWLFHWEYTLFSDKPIFFILEFLNLICSGLKQCPSWGAQVTELSANGRAQLSQLCKTGGGPLGAGLWFSPVKCWWIGFAHPSNPVFLCLFYYVLLCSIGFLYLGAIEALNKLTVNIRLSGSQHQLWLDFRYFPYSWVGL